MQGARARDWALDNAFIEATVPEVRGLYNSVNQVKASIFVTFFPALNLI